MLNNLNKLKNQVKATLNRKENNKKLLHAAIMGDLAGVQKAIIDGANINTKSKDGKETALFRAAQYGNLATVKHLLNSGADVNKTSTTWQLSPLYVAARYGKTLIVKELLQHPQINLDLQQGELNNTALIIAAQFGHVEVVKELIKAGANIHLKNHDNKTALDQANKNQNKELVALLNTDAANRKQYISRMKYYAHLLNQVSRVAANTDNDFTTKLVDALPNEILFHIANYAAASNKQEPPFTKQIQFDIYNQFFKKPSVQPADRIADEQYVNNLTFSKIA